jgi:hypothetical protein
MLGKVKSSMCGGWVRDALKFIKKGVRTASGKRGGVSIPQQIEPAATTKKENADLISRRSLVTDRQRLASSIL